MVSPINFARVKSILLDVSNGVVSREEASNWAMEMSNALDAKAVVCDVTSYAEEKIIWRTLEFLSGVDLKDSPISYLHNEEDIMNFCRRIDAEKLGSHGTIDA